MSILQHINFMGKSEEVDSAITFFNSQKQQKTILKFSLDLLSVTEQYKQWNINKQLICWMKQVALNLWQKNRKIASDQLSKNYDLWSEVICYTEVLNSSLCDFNDACILVRGNIITTRRNNPTQVVFKNFAPFINCITKIDGLTIDNAESWDLVMPMYNWIE